MSIISDLNNYQITRRTGFLDGVANLLASGPDPVGSISNIFAFAPFPVKGDLIGQGLARLAGVMNCWSEVGTWAIAGEWQSESKAWRRSPLSVLEGDLNFDRVGVAVGVMLFVEDGGFFWNTRAGLGVFIIIATESGDLSLSSFADMRCLKKLLSHENIHMKCSVCSSSVLP